jgi:hypothetical protein
MISTEQFTKLVDEVLKLEADLGKLGRVKIETYDGPYWIREQALAETIPEQKVYNALRREYLAKKRIVDSYDMISRFENSWKK